MNKGIKTTEFWLSAIAILGLILPSIWGLIAPDKAAIYSSIIVAIYTIARSLVKTTITLDDDKIVEAIGKTIVPIIEKDSKKK